MAKKNEIKKTGESTADLSLKYGLQSILTTKFAYSYPKEKFNKDNVDLINYNVTPRINFNSEQENIIIAMQVEAVVKETSEQIMYIETNFAYKIKDFKEHIIERTESGQKQIKFKDVRNEGLFRILISLSYSTMRGVVLERAKGTILGKVYLPIVDPNLFFKKVE